MDEASDLPVLEDVVFVAIALPNGDGSGRSRILGVYLDMWKAEARCYRSMVKTGGQPLAIIKCVIDQDREED